MAMGQIQLLPCLIDIGQLNHPGLIHKEPVCHRNPRRLHSVCKDGGKACAIDIKIGAKRMTTIDKDA